MANLYLFVSRRVPQCGTMRRSTPRILKAAAHHGSSFLHSRMLGQSSDYYYTAEELNKHYDQPQMVARSYLMALMSLLSVQDGDSQTPAKLNRTLHGAMHALRAGGYEQDNLE